MTSPTLDVPSVWRAVLEGELREPYVAQLAQFLATERGTKTVFPPDAEVFRALALTPLERVRVVLIGQDPYHDDGQAHGLCFSVRPPTPPPPSLRNVFRELQSDVGVTAPIGGDLTCWAERGVLLLNSVLTVVAHEPGSHAGKGWERFTDAIVRAVNDRDRPAVFCLWGAYAKKKGKLVDRTRHEVVETGHPSPLSVKHFLGSRPFSQVDAALARLGEPAMDWSITSDGDGGNGSR